MKIGVLREIYSNKGIYVLESCWADFPLDKIVNRGWLSFRTLKFPGIQWGNRYQEQNDYWLSEHVPGQIGFLHPDGRRLEFEGLIFYTSLTEMVYFISKRIDPDHDGPLSVLVRQARDRRGRVNRALIERKLVDENDEGQHQHPRFIHERQVSLPVVMKGMEDYRVTPVGKGDEILWVKEWRPRVDKAIFAAESYRSVDGYLIPYLQFIRRVNGLGTPGYNEMDDANFMLFDGTKHSWCRSLDDVSPALLDRMDMQGFMYYEPDFDIMPMDHLESCAVFRVPPRSELAELVPKMAKTIEEGSPRDPLLNYPALVFDSHYPFVINSKTQIIDHSESLFWLLARTVRGIFIPGQRARMFPVRNIPEKESFLVLARPSELCR